MIKRSNRLFTEPRFITYVVQVQTLFNGQIQLTLQSIFSSKENVTFISVSVGMVRG